MGLTEEQKNLAMVIAGRTSGFISVISSLFIVRDIRKKYKAARRGDRPPLTTSLVLSMSLGDIGSSFFAFFIGPWMIPTEGDFPGAAGTQATCDAQAFLFGTFFGSSNMTNGIMALVFWLIICREKPEKDLRAWYWQGLMFGYPWLWGIGYAAASRYSVAPAEYPLVWYCYGMFAEPGTQVAVISFWVVFASFLMMGVLIVLSMGALVRYVHKQEQRMDRFRRQGSQVSGNGTTTSATLANRVRTVQVAKQGFLYTAAFLAISIPTMIQGYLLNVSSGGDYYEMGLPAGYWVFYAAFFPLQGFFNFFIYFRPKFAALRQREGLTFGQATLRVLHLRSSRREAVSESAPPGDGQSRRRKWPKLRSTQATEGLTSIGQGTRTSASHGISEREPSWAEGLEISLAEAAANEESSPENSGSDEGDVDRTIHDRTSRSQEARLAIGAQDCIPPMSEGTEGDPELNQDAITEEQAMDIWLRSNSELEAERLRESQLCWRDMEPIGDMDPMGEGRYQRTINLPAALVSGMGVAGIGVAGGHWERPEARQEGMGEGEGCRLEGREGSHPDRVYIDRPRRADEQGLLPPDSGAGYLYNPFDAVAHALFARDSSEGAGENSADTTNSPPTSIPSDDSALRAETLDLQRAVVESQAAHIAHTRQQVEQDIRFRQEMEMTVAASARDVARRRSIARRRTSGTGSDEVRLIRKAAHESLVDEQDQQEAARKYHRDLERALAVSRDETKVSEDYLVEDVVRQNLEEAAAQEEERGDGGSSDEEMLRRVMMQSLDEERAWR